ncbi:sigma-54 dependent transcriptional regulator [Enterovirga sp.]|uniref:sigma-54-dependent transcriptional regulator n=1 Tax=Enterovirga sp. TaxID=2026350 RepID=UPI002CF8589C|nr:sigma-54 dependent transcriptional regulator [Enterovirga sp.]HMO30973.1 sigma-54 dependent transcriptional regulator [Enterovirga sp.]
MKRPAGNPRTRGIVIVIEDDETLRLSIEQWLKIEGYEATAFSSAGRALALIDRHFPGVVVTDLRMPEMDGIQVLKKVMQIDADLPVVVISAYGDIPQAVEAMRNGAYDFLEKPFDPERLSAILLRASEKRRLTLENRFLRSQVGVSELESRIIGNSEAIQKVRYQIREIASASVNVIIYGETGTGKELVARCIHDLSPRRQNHYVAINCGAIPETLFEGELFGSEAGAYTGAHKRRIGRLEYADQGTLFLDEIESMPLSSQAKLLRAIQEKTIERLGSYQSIKSDFRTIAASKEDLSKNNMFRSDLYYRLSVVEIWIPPLRERAEDIPLLFEQFVSEAVKTHSRPVRRIDEALMRDYSVAEWPGNVRELRNAAERFALGLDTRRSPSTEPQRSLADQVDAFEHSLLEKALASARGNIAAVMMDLDIPRRTLNEKMRKYGIDRHRFTDRD